MLPVAYLTAGRWPAAFLWVGGHDTAPRAVSPFEYTPMLIAIALCVGLAPRFHDWDRHGTARHRTLALINAAVVVIVPLVVFFTALPLYQPPTGDPPATALIPLANNVAISALTAIVLVGILGALGWFATTYALLHLQANAPAAVPFLPFTMSIGPTGTLDTTPRWAWIAALSLIALAVTWTAAPFPSAARPANPKNDERSRATATAAGAAGAGGCCRPLGAGCGRTSGRDLADALRRTG